LHGWHLVLINFVSNLVDIKASQY